MSPAFYLEECPLCKEDFPFVRKTELASQWTCPKCDYDFSINWTLRQLVQYPVDSELVSDFILCDVLDLSFFSDLQEDPALCCDSSIDICSCPPEEKILVHEPAEFLEQYYLRSSDIYSTEVKLWDCWDCHFYLTQDCLPLRNVVRFIKKTNSLPAILLSRCDSFTPDVISYSNLDE